MRTLKLVLLGFGNVGQGFARLLLSKKRELADVYETEALITGVATAGKGSLVDNEGVDIQKALDYAAANGRFENARALSAFDVIDKSQADAVIELSPLSIADGQPAIDHIVYAFNKGRHVITANKGPVAWAFRRLNALAAEKKLAFLYETTVMDGAPIFNMVKYALPGCKVLSFEGILNTTTNYILAELEKGANFDDAVREAQKRGFAEADPSMDIKGMDAAAKTCALANALMGAGLTPPEMLIQGIENITANDLVSARQGGETIKLLCRGYADASGVCGVVKPERVPLGHLFATVNGRSSALSITTDLMGKITILEHDPKIEQTAYGIYSDMLTLISLIY
jgi:homoserine dehydrogenase